MHCILALAGKGPNGAQISWFMHLVIASTLAATLFYLLEASSGRCILTSTFERPLEPLHYLMWMVTMVTDSRTLLHGIRSSWIPAVLNYASERTYYLRSVVLSASQNIAVRTFIGR